MPELADYPDIETRMSCIHQSPGDTTGKYRCTSNRLLHRDANNVASSVCESCPYRNRPNIADAASRPRGLGDSVAKLTKATGLDKLAHAYTKITGKSCGCGERQAKLNQLFPYPAAENPGVKQWAVGITTAPRTQHRTLPECVASVKAAGWSPILFSEPGTQTSDIDAEVRVNENRLGLWHNWLRMSKTLLEEFPDADAILTIQDDTVFHPQSKAWAESHLWPTKRMCLFSFYCPMHYSVRCDIADAHGKVVKTDLPYEKAKQYLTKKRRREGFKRIDRPKPTGFHRIRTTSLWGACALVFQRELLERVVSHKVADTWQGVAPKRKKTQKRTARQNQIREWKESRQREPWRIQNSDTAIGRIVNKLGGELWFTEPSLADHIADASADGVGHGGRGGRRSARQLAAGDLRDVFGEMK